MFSIAIQLALFFVGASAAIWVDQVYNGNIGRLTMRPTFFKAVMITVLTVCTTIPSRADLVLTTVSL